MDEKYVAKASIKAGATPWKVHIRTIEVEEPYPIFTVVLVDDKFRARLNPNA